MDTSVGQPVQPGLFQLPDELVFSALSQSFPCRDPQIKALATLLYPRAAPCGNVVVFGTGSTGKSIVTEAVLERMLEDAAELKYAVVNSIECVTARHLFETTVAKVAASLGWEDVSRRCENLSQLVVQLSRMILHREDRPFGWRFVLVFDAIDRQRDAPPTLLPALARLCEIMPNLTTIFIMTCPLVGVLRISAVPHIHFPNYTKEEFIRILSATPPPSLPNTTPEETAELWSRFVGPVHDSLTKAAARSLPDFRHACTALWPRFTAPILAGTHGPREFTKLLVAARVHLQDESVLDQGTITVQGPCTTGAASNVSSSSSSSRNGRNGSNAQPTGQMTTPTLYSRSVVAASTKDKAPDLSTLLPATARLLLLSAYLASHNATKHDLTLFSTHYHGRRRRRGGGGGGAGRGPRSKHRKIARRLLGAHAFVFERMQAIYIALRREWAADRDGYVSSTDSKGPALDCDVAMAVATLSSLRLLVRVGGGGDPTDHGGKWRVNVGWEVIRALGRGMGVEVEEWLIE